MVYRVYEIHMPWSGSSTFQFGKEMINRAEYSELLKHKYNASSWSEYDVKHRYITKNNEISMRSEEYCQSTWGAHRAYWTPYWSCYSQSILMIMSSSSDIDLFLQDSQVYFATPLNFPPDILIRKRVIFISYFINVEKLKRVILMSPYFIREWYPQR